MTERWTPTEQEVDAAERVLYETFRGTAVAAGMSGTPAHRHWRSLAEAVLEAAHEARTGSIAIAHRAKRQRGRDA